MNKSCKKEVKFYNDSTKMGVEKENPPFSTLLGNKSFYDNQLARYIGAENSVKDAFRYKTYRTCPKINLGGKTPLTKVNHWKFYGFINNHKNCRPIIAENNLNIDDKKFK